MKRIQLVSILMATANRPQTIAFESYEAFSKWRNENYKDILQYTVQEIDFLPDEL